jgi:hypothetical protein
MFSACFILVSCLDYPWTLKMETTYSFETSVYFQRTTPRYIPEDRTLYVLIGWSLLEEVWCIALHCYRIYLYPNAITALWYPCRHESSIASTKSTKQSRQMQNSKSKLYRLSHRPPPECCLANSKIAPELPESFHEKHHSVHVCTV